MKKEDKKTTKKPVVKKATQKKPVTKKPAAKKTIAKAVPKKVVAKKSPVKKVVKKTINNTPKEIKPTKTDFDLSLLNYKELIDLYYKIEEFIDMLDNEEQKIIDMEEGNANE